MKNPLQELLSYQEGAREETPISAASQGVRGDIPHTYARNWWLRFVPYLYFCSRFPIYTASVEEEKSHMFFALKM